MRLTENQYNTFFKKNNNTKESKYKNKKVLCDGHTFDSKKERDYYLKFKAMEELGLIRDLELQKEFVLQDSFKLNNKTRRKIMYKADFSYVSTEDDKLHVLDVKSEFTRKNEVYRIKKKLFEKKYGIELEEVL